MHYNALSGGDAIVIRRFTASSPGVAPKATTLVALPYLDNSNQLKPNPLPLRLTCAEGPVSIADALR